MRTNVGLEVMMWHVLSMQTDLTTDKLRTNTGLDAIKKL